jgi:single-strand DNA-binding protein
MSVNKAILIGFVGSDPEVKYLDNGTPVANFRIATSESYTNRGGEKVTQTEWHSIVLWRGLAEITEKYIRKGSQVYIEGRIRTRTWDDRDGNKRYTTEIVADTMQMMGKKNEGGTEAPLSHGQSNEDPSASKTSADPIVENNGTDDLPF